MSSKNIMVRPSRLKTLAVGDTIYRSSYDIELTKADMERASRELNERDGEREDCIRDLREKLESDKKFRYRTDDQYLLSFLRFRKYDVNKTYKILVKGRSVRVKHPEIFGLPTNMERLCNTGFLSRLPYTDEEGRILITAYFDKWSMSEMSFHEMLQLSTSFFEVACANPLCQVNGTIGIWDLKGLSMSHITGFLNPSTVWALSSLLQECFPNRIQLGILINCHGVLLTAFNTAKFFLKKKLVDRIKLIGSDMTELHQYVNPAILPKRLGGMLEDDECSLTEHMVDNLPYLKYMRSFVTGSNGLME